MAVQSAPEVRLAHPVKPPETAQSVWSHLPFEPFASPVNASPLLAFICTSRTFGLASFALGFVRVARNSPGVVQRERRFWRTSQSMTTGCCWALLPEDNDDRIRPRLDRKSTRLNSS